MYAKHSGKVIGKNKAHSLLALRMALQGTAVALQIGIKYDIMQRPPSKLDML